MSEALTYDDILLVPSYNHWESRKVVDTSVTDRSGLLNLEIPVMTSNMDTITESEMANFICSKGGIGVLHRFMSVEDNVKMLKSKFYLNFPNGLTFNYYLLFYTVAKKLSFKFFPLSWCEDDQVSNLNLFNHVKEWLGVIFIFLFKRKVFMRGTEEKREYNYEIYYDS